MICYFYKLKCKKCKELYIGSTRDMNGIVNRLYNHRSDGKKRKSKIYIHMNECGFKSAFIELIDDMEMKNDEERFKKEQQYIEMYDTIENGLNTKRAYRSKEVFKKLKAIADKKYNIKNRDKINERIKIYRSNLKKDLYNCECCNYKTNRKDSYDRHNKSKRHLNKHSIFTSEFVKKH